ncbi:uncharacterized protein VP01_8876g1, partial [Puccinia sorghi]
MPSRNNSKKKASTSKKASPTPTKPTTEKPAIRIKSKKNRGKNSSEAAWHTQNNRGSIFVSQITRELDHHLGIKLHPTTAFHPQTDG